MEKEYWLVVISGIFSGFVVFGAGILAELGFSFYQISVLPSLFTIVLLFPFVVFRKECKIRNEMVKLYVFYGLISAFLAFSQWLPIFLGTPISIIVLLLYTQPLWTVILSKFLMKEKLTKLKILSMIIVLLGVVFIVNPLNIQKIGSFTGVILSLLGGFLLSLWVILGRVAGKKEYNPITTKFSNILFYVIFMLIFYPIVSIFIKDASIINLSLNFPIIFWLYFLIFEILAGLIPHISYYIGVKKVTASDAGIILLLEPVSAAILAAIFLGQTIASNVIIGGFLILIANYLAIKERS